MEDKAIVGLYWERNEKALDETSLKYGSYVRSIARNILGNDADAEECVNDAYLKAWNSIPPNRPDRLSTYLGKIVRNLSFDRYKYRMAEKRGGGELAVILDELADCVSGTDDVEQEMNKAELARAINQFLETLPREKRNIFLCRYWYAMPISEIARKFGKTSGSVSVILNRIRNKLKEYLTKRGFEL